MDDDEDDNVGFNKIRCKAKMQSSQLPPIEVKQQELDAQSAFPLHNERREKQIYAKKSFNGCSWNFRGAINRYERRIVGGKAVKRGTESFCLVSFPKVCREVGKPSGMVGASLALPCLPCLALPWYQNFKSWKAHDIKCPHYNEREELQAAREENLGVISS